MTLRGCGGRYSFCVEATRVIRRVLIGIGWGVLLLAVVLGLADLFAWLFTH